jgi:hypothetical protein
VPAVSMKDGCRSSRINLQGGSEGGSDVGISRSDSAQSLRLMDHQQVSEDGGLHHVDMRKFLIRVQVLLKSKSKYTMYACFYPFSTTKTERTRLINY